MKYLLTIFGLVHCSVTCAQLPTVEWAVMNEVNNDDMGTAIDADGQAVYTTGFIRGHVNLDPADQDLIPPYNPYWLFGDADRGDANVFVQKLDIQGNMVWGAFFGGTQDDEGRGIALDNAGNVYVTGFFQGQAHFDAHYMSGPAVVTGSGKKDVFILKLSPAGSLLWAKAIGGAHDDIGEALALDNAGNVIVTGRFGGTVDFDPGAGASPKTSNGDADMFVLKLDPDGQFIWAQAFGGSGTDAGRSVAVDATDNTYITGHFMETVDFGTSSPIQINSAGASDIFIGKLDAQGEMTWAGRMGGPANDEGRTVRVSALGHVFVSGSFMQTADLDPTGSTDAHTSNGGRDIFICRLDANGQLDWAAAAGGTGDDAAVGMDTDPAGNVLSIGYFQKEVDFDPGVGVDNRTSIGYIDIYWQKLSADGQLLWAAQVGEHLGQFPQSVAIDGIGRSFSTGGFHQAYYSGGVDFDPSPIGVAELDTWSYPSVDLFVQSLDASGGFQWANRVEGRCCFGGVTQIEVDVEGNLLAAGSFQVRIDVDPGSEEYFLDALPNSGQGVAYSIFIQKLDTAGQLLWARMLRCKWGINRLEQLATDAEGNVYVAGHFKDSIDLDPGPGDQWAYTSIGNQSIVGDIFIVKLNPDGNLLWGRHLQGDSTGDNETEAMAVEQNQGLYLYAHAEGTVDVDPGAGVTQITDRPYLLHLDPLGNFEWVSLVKDTSNSNGNIEVGQIATFNDGTFRIAGLYSGIIDIETSISSYILPQEHGFYVARFNETGELLAASTLPLIYYALLDNPTFDNDENIIVRGYVNDTADLDPGPGVFYLQDDGLGNLDRYLLKITNNGALGWVRQFPTGTSGEVEFGNLEIDLIENIVCPATIRNSIDVDPGPDVYALEAAQYSGSSYNYDPAIVCFNSSGVLQWAFRFGNEFGFPYQIDDGLDHIKTLNDFIFGVGSGFYGPIDFDPSADTLFLRSHNGGQFIVKWRRQDLITTAPELTAKEVEPIWAFPNPATEQVTVQWPFIAGVRDLRLLNSNGQLVQSRSLNELTNYVQLTLDYPSGLYLLQLRTETETHNAKLIIR